ncbi:hypothetical protein [Desulfitobacterium metallireducens]|uniref:Scaffolding protein n=1 Tax=Desulfitobacterium metallireducens DSM 15288 TaxID=871968 RepID=W0EHL2_9FIRM|nr:hypothetical protein [Desulfitobacterium metallireducens]AHF08566.1 hypothetical protein DESME_08905 [Desulfitobacterium metallireducens DSM 15288]
MADELGASLESTPLETNTSVDTSVVDGSTVDTSSTANPNASQVDQPQLYSLKVAGEEKQLPIEEVIKLAQMGDDYTRKTQTLAQERKQYEAIQAKAKELQKYGWDIDTLLSDFNRQAIEAEATKNNIDPAVWGEFQNTKQQLSSVQNELNSFKQNQTLLEQKTTLAEKPFFKDWESEVETTAKELNTDYLTAYTLLAKDHLPEILAKHEQDLKSAKETAIKEYLAEKTKPQGTVESAGQSPVIETTAPKTFAEAKANSIELLKSLMSK